MIVKGRLGKEMEELKMLADEQVGFWKGRNTTDNVCIAKNLEKILHVVCGLKGSIWQVWTGRDYCGNT